MEPVVAIGFVMVGAGRRGGRDVLGQVTIVNQSGQCIYNQYVKHRFKIKNYRTEISGIKPENLANGITFKKVRQAVCDLIRRHVLVGHDLEKILKMLRLCHPDWNKRDSAEFFRTEKRQPSLKELAAEYLSISIQNGAHNPYQNALATLKLYNKYKKDWDTWVEEQLQSDEEQSDEEISYEEQSDEEMTDEEQSDEEMTDEEQSDEEMTDEEQSDEEITDEEYSDEEYSDEE